MYHSDSHVQSTCVECDDKIVLQEYIQTIAISVFAVRPEHRVSHVQAMSSQVVTQTTNFFVMVKYHNHVVTKLTFCNG
jgi:hypothetical protein